MDGLQTLSDEPFQVAVPACKCEIPDDMSMMLYESHMTAKADDKRSGLTRSLTQLETLMAKQDSAEERKAIEANLDSLNEYFSSLQEVESAIESALTSSKPEDISEETEQKRQTLN